MKVLTPNDVEKDIQRKFLQTGLIDLIFGIYFISINFLFDMNQFIKLGTIFFIIAVYHLIRSKVVEPRIGICKFSISRSKLFRIQNIVIASLTLIIVVLTILSSMDILKINQNILSISASLIVFLIMFLLSRLYSFYRLALYGALLSCAILFMNNFVTVLGEFKAELVMFVVPGSLIVVYALIKMISFVKRNEVMRGDYYE